MILPDPLTGILGSTPTVLGFVCLSYVPLLATTDDSEVAGYLDRERRRITRKRKEREEEDILAVMLTLLS